MFLDIRGNPVDRRFGTRCPTERGLLRREFILAITDVVSMLVALPFRGRFGPIDSLGFGRRFWAGMIQGGIIQSSDIFQL